MALPHQTKVFAAKEARIAKLLTDPYGAPPATWATSVILVGFKKLTIAETIKTAYLKGDNRVLDSDSVPDQVSGTLTCAKLNLDAMAVMFSTAVVDSGTTPNQLATFARLSTDSLNYFKIEGRSASADPNAGDVLFSVWKCKLSGGPTLGLNEEDYQLFDFPVTVMPLLADNRLYTETIRETAVVLT